MSLQTENSETASYNCYHEIPPNRETWERVSRYRELNGLATLEEAIVQMFQEIGFIDKDPTA
jgi:hypothetical protein